MSIKIKIFLSVVLVLTLGILSGAFYFNKELNLQNSDSTEAIIVQVESGTISGIADGLQQNNLLRSALIFDIYAKFARKTVYTGYFKLPRNMTPKQMLNALGDDQFRVYKMTFQEGWRMERIAQKMEENEICPYSDFVSAAMGKEGYLFPDTYYFKKGQSAESIVKMMTDNFNKQTQSLSLTKDDLILASIVERETAGDDRTIIAGIYKNRLKIKMKLDADPTVQYAKDSNAILNLSPQEIKTFDYWTPITSKDYYAVDSPYNAYLNVGLPPGPICSPSMKSIEAAQNPDKNDYLYFFHVNGQIYPSKTLEEHNLNKQKYLYK